MGCSHIISFDAWPHRLMSITLSVYLPRMRIDWIYAQLILTPDFFPPDVIYTGCAHIVNIVDVEHLNNALVTSGIFVFAPMAPIWVDLCLVHMNVGMSDTGIMLGLTHIQYQGETLLPTPTPHDIGVAPDIS